MNRTRWIILSSVYCITLSLIAAAFTHNSNWALNIPLAGIGGAIIGWITWSFTYGAKAKR